MSSLKTRIGRLEAKSPSCSLSHRAIQVLPAGTAPEDRRCPVCGASIAVLCVLDPYASPPAAPAVR